MGEKKKKNISCPKFNQSECLEMREPVVFLEEMICYSIKPRGSISKRPLKPWHCD